MSKYNTAATNFLRGEIGPKALRRIDVEDYRQSCEELTNFTINPMGGAFKRSGSRFIKALGAVSSPSLYPFISSSREGFLVMIDYVMGSGQMFRVYNSQGVEQVVDETQYLAGDGVLYTLPVTAGVVVQDFDPRDYYTAQVADAMFITHTSGLMPPAILIRTGTNTFSVGYYGTFSLPDPNFLVPREALRVPYRTQNFTATTITPSSTSGAVILTASAALFNAQQIGSIFKLNIAGVTGAVRITGFTSSTQVAGAVVGNNLGGAVATTDWEESAWSDYRGWPKVVASFQGRLLWANSKYEIDKIWASVAGNYLLMMGRKYLQDSVNNTSGNNYFGDKADIDAFGFSPQSDEINEIAWIKGAQSTLKIGTTSTEYIATGRGELLSSLNIDVSAETNYGSRLINPATYGDEIFFITRDGRRLRNYNYSENNGSNLSLDLSVLAHHMSNRGTSNDGKVRYGFKRLTLQHSRNTFWLINGNNELVGLSYDRELNVSGWHGHLLGGDVLEVQGLCCIPNLNIGDTKPSMDFLFLLVKRVVNAATVYYIEKVPVDFDGANIIGNTATADEDISAFLDCCLHGAIIANTQIITGLSHLEGEEVTVCVNGVLLGDFTVAGGEIDTGVQLQNKTYVVGYKYTARLVTVPLEAGGDWGTSMGAIKRSDRVIVAFYKTLAASVGYELSLTKVPFTVPNLFTGDKRVNIQSNPDLRTGVVIESSDPYPCNVLGLSVRGVTYD